jgi:hypothetical protein
MDPMQTAQGLRLHGNLPAADEMVPLIIFTPSYF